MMRKILPWLITLAGCFLVTGALAAVKYQQITAAIAFGASFPETYEVVSARQVSSMTHTPVRRIGGTIRRPEFVEISSEVGGRIVSLPFSAGAVVQKGDAILKLFSADLVAQQEALRADRNLVITQLGRSRTLKEQALIAQGDIDVQEARLSALNAQIKAIDAQLTRLTIRAPFTGRMGIYTHVVGDMLDSGEVVAAFTGLGNERWIDFKVPQGLAKISVGDEASLYDLDGTFLGSATVIVVSDSIDTDTRTFDVRASANGIDLKHGELVQVEVASGTSLLVYELPPSSVRWDTDGTYIYQLVDAEPGAQRPYRAKVQRIDLVDETADTALFTAALDETGLYATTGSFKLKEGVLAQLGDGAN
jgi:membrane fusion protein (multidrug efflux system)